MPYDYDPNHSEPLTPPKPLNHTERLTKLTAIVKLCRSLDSVAYAVYRIGGDGVSIIPVQHSMFRDWLAGLFFAKYEMPPDDRPLRKVIRSLNAYAVNYIHRVPVHLRVGASDRNIVLGLMNRTGEMVEIARDGWRVVSGDSHMFHLGLAAAALPTPVQPDDPVAALNKLRAILNLTSGPDWTRCLIWLLNALWPLGPYPILALTGIPGCGKSTTARLLRTLIDPSRTPLFMLPRSERDLLDHTRHSWVPTFDHVSQIPNRILETLASIATGSGLKRTANYDCTDGHHLDIHRPIILALEHDVRPDVINKLRPRMCNVALSPLTPQTRRIDEQIQAEFENNHPEILGALCTALCTAMDKIDQIKLETPCRFAGAVARALAAAPALGLTPEAILEAANESPYRPDDPVLKAVWHFAHEQPGWEGTSTEFLEAIRPRWNRAFPDNPYGLSCYVRKAQAHLETAGVQLAFSKSRGITRIRVGLSSPTDLPGQNQPNGINELPGAPAN